MKFFKSATEKLFTKEVEYKLHEKVVKDLTEGKKDLGIWGKAFVDADGDEKKTEVVYIKLMVQHYKDTAKSEAELEAILNENYQKEQLKALRKDQKALRKDQTKWMLSEAKKTTSTFIANFLKAIVYVLAGLIAFIIIMDFI